MYSILLKPSLDLKLKIRAKGNFNLAHLCSHLIELRPHLLAVE